MIFIGRRLSIEDVNKEFSDRGYLLIDTTYSNNKTKLKYKCVKHADFGEMLIRFIDLKNGHGCPNCASEKLSIFRKRPRPHRIKVAEHNIESLKAYYLERGFTLLEESYTNSSTPMRYKCHSHSDKVLSMPLSEFKRKRGCTYCSRESNRGENHCHWKGGISTLNYFLRARLREWKLKSISKFSNRCYVTDEQLEEFDIHHIKPFHVIRDEVLAVLQLPIYENISMYTQEDLSALSQKIVEYHENCEGVPLRHDIHKLFHSIYGFDAGLEQLEEFKYLYKTGNIHIKEVI